MSIIGPMGKSKPCKAHTSRLKRPCKKQSIVGGAVCDRHGGRAPQVKRKAQERILEAFRDVIDPKRNLRAYATLAYGVSLADFYDSDGNELPVGAWTPAMRSALKRRTPRAMDVTPGERGKAKIVHDIELYDRLQALQALAKHLGLFEVAKTQDDGHITISWAGSPPPGLPGLIEANPALIEAK